MITKSRKEMEKLTNIRRFFRISLSIQGLYHKAKPWGEIIFQEEKQIFERYMDRKAIRFLNLVHAVQPECIASSRISGNPEIGDYAGFGDSLIPVQAKPLPWETRAAMNDTWGFKAQDRNWKTPERLIRLLVSIVSKGGISSTWGPAL
jgi:alpha-L-fucosidase